MFEYPSFEIGNVAYTAIGAAVFWSKWGRNQLRAYGLSEIVALVPVRPKLKIAIEFSIFIVLGCIVGIGIASPSNAPQALSAGMGWTGFFTTRK